MDQRRGGPASTLWEIVPALQRLGHHVEVCSLDAHSEGEFPAPLHVLGYGVEGFSFSWPLFVWLQEHARRFDHIVVRGIWQWHGLAVGYVARRNAIPYSVFVHGMLDPWFKRQYPLKHLKKQIYWLLFEYWVLRFARYVFFTSEPERHAAESTFFPYRCNATVIQYGTTGFSGDREQVANAFYSEVPSLRENPYLLYLGRLHPKKGIDMLLRVMNAAVPQSYHLVIAGPEEDREYVRSLKQLVCDGDLQGRVHFVGMIAGQVKWGCIVNAEALILPSHQENFGVVVAEALSCGIPVLLSSKVNIAPEIEATGAGLVGEDTEFGVAEVLSAWHALSSEQRDAMGKAGRALFEKEFSIDAAATALVNHLVDLK